MKSTFGGKRILVTGGTGSIGAGLVEALLRAKPKQIRIFSRDDSKQFECRSTLPENAPVNFLLGDVRDRDRLFRAMENIEIVFHAAALKHVGACERNPFEAVHTNVIGTQNVIDTALERNVERVVVISTDKAASPTNVMGTTKLLAEKLVLASFFYKGNKKTKLCAVRFGNVLWSRGSVTPLFLSQMKRKEPLTVTDPNMTRFFMTIPQAVSLVLKAAELTEDREVFVLKMPVLKVGELARAILECGIEKEIITKTLPITVTGKRDGDRLHEKLLTEDESLGALETKDMFIIQPNLSFSPAHPAPHRYKGARPAPEGAYASDKQKLLSKEEIKKLLLESWPRL